LFLISPYFSNTAAKSEKEKEAKNPKKMKMISIVFISFSLLVSTMNAIIDFKSDDLCKRLIKCTGSYDLKHSYSVKCLKQPCQNTSHVYECSHAHCAVDEDSCSLFVNVNKYLKTISKIQSRKTDQYKQFVANIKTCQIDKKYDEMDILNDVCLNDDGCIFKEQFIKISGTLLTTYKFFIYF
jgi:hypothetical protein